MLRIKTLEKTSIGQITETFNAAFSSYVPPIVFKKEQFEDKFSSEGGRLDLSVGAFENDELVAFILHFVDTVGGKRIVYNGGTGVIPEYRGNQLTSKMYEYVEPKLKRDGVSKMVLEVFTHNLSALKIYQSRGFKVIREVNCFRGKLKRSSRKLDQSYEMIELKEFDWLRLQSFWDIYPTWQNSNSTMSDLLNQNVHLGVVKDGELIGYLIYNPKNKRVHQMAIDKKHRKKGVGSHLLDHVSALEDQEISFINIDCKMSNFKSFLEKRGLKNYVNQYEMELNFSS